MLFRKNRISLVKGPLVGERPAGGFLLGGKRAERNGTLLLEMLDKQGKYSGNGIWRNEMMHMELCLKIEDQESGFWQGTFWVKYDKKVPCRQQKI